MLVFLILVLLMAIITLEGKIFDSMNAKTVSYTHLDVYKRQVHALQALAGDVHKAGQTLPWWISPGTVRRGWAS